MIILARRWFSGIFTLVLFLSQSAGVAAPVSKQALLMQSEAFSRSYSAKYTSLQGHSADTILIDLAESLEDILVSGSHISGPSLDYKIQQLEQHLFEKLKNHSCASNSSPAVTESLLQSGAVSSLVSLSNDEQWEMTDAQFGTLAGTVVQLMQSGPRRRFCSSQSFNQFVR